jgi:lipopolysaccharide/colanic/teichoic acid biosynthesis glycosyltransferase
MRVNTPLGLFHLWEADARDDLEWEEKMVIESYYSATRSTWGDIKIFGKAFFATMVKKC